LAVCCAVVATAQVLLIFCSQVATARGLHLQALCISTALLACRPTSALRAPRTGRVHQVGKVARAFFHAVSHSQLSSSMPVGAPSSACLPCSCVLSRGFTPATSTQTSLLFGAAGSVGTRLKAAAKRMSGVYFLSRVPTTTDGNSVFFLWTKKKHAQQMLTGTMAQAASACCALGIHFLERFHRVFFTAHSTHRAVTLGALWSVTSVVMNFCATRSVQPT
jgi:hypothetical protein